MMLADRSRYQWNCQNWGIVLVHLNMYLNTFLAFHQATTGNKPDVIQTSSYPIAQLEMINCNGTFFLSSCREEAR